MGYAIVDVETTGIGTRTNEIVEIAIVAADWQGNVEWAFHTLINPQRDVGPTRIHGIRASDVTNAPVFADVAGRIAQLLAGRLFVAHNARFDVDHISSSYEKIGVDAPIPNLCTMQTARQLGIRPTKLSDVCDYFSVTNPYPHQALGDAMATAEVLKALIPLVDPASMTAAQIEVAKMPPWPNIQVRTVDGVHRPGRPAAAPTATKTARRRPDQPLAVSTPISIRSSNDVEDSYMAAVQRAVEDRELDGSEVAELDTLAAELKLSTDARDELHRVVLQAQAATAHDDGVITESERIDMHALATELGLEAADAEAALSSPEHVPVHESRQLKPGDRVVFTGDMDTPRDELKAAAEKAGLRVTGSVSGKTTALIVADTATQSGKAKSARAKGVRVIVEHSFARMLKEMPEAPEEPTKPIPARPKRGRHYSSWTDEVKWLKRQKRDDEAIAVLWEIVEATEAECRTEGLGVAPWAYAQLAIMYRKQKNPAAELAILERYDRQQKAPGATPAKLKAQLTTARKAAR